VERKVKLCGYTASVLMDGVMSIDAVLETTHKAYVAGELEIARNHVRDLEQKIDNVWFFFKLAEKACDTKPGAGGIFERFVDSLRGGVKEISVDPRKAEEYRFYKYRLSEGVKALLSD
jgi:hypothetical protein